MFGIKLWNGKPSLLYNFLRERKFNEIAARLCRPLEPPQSEQAGKTCGEERGKMNSDDSSDP